MVDFNHPLAGKAVTYKLKIICSIEVPEEKIKALKDALAKEGAGKEELEAATKDLSDTLSSIGQAMYGAQGEQKPSEEQKKEGDEENNEDKDKEKGKKEEKVEEGEVVE